MTKLKIYLAGGALEVYYRKHVKREFGNNFDLIDPMVKNGVYVDIKEKRIVTDKTAEEIVVCDKSWIDKSDILVAYINKYSVGTSMEILYAYDRNKPVYLILTPGRGFEDDIWLKYHATKIFFGIDACFNCIENQLIAIEE